MTFLGTTALINHFVLKNFYKDTSNMSTIFYPRIFMIKFIITDLKSNRAPGEVFLPAEIFPFILLISCLKYILQIYHY